jgi:hypothetical protein
MMIRSAVCVTIALVFLPAAASAASVPVPKPKPGAEAAPDPQAAIARMVGDSNTLGANVTAYAPASAPDLRPRPSGEVSLRLSARLSDDGPRLSDGVVWRVFREFPGEDGELPLIHKARGGNLQLRLKADRYIVHASYGRAAMSRTLDLRRERNSATLVLDAGGLQLDAVLDSTQERIADEAVFDLYVLEGQDRRHIGEIRPGRIARLPAGAYHVVSRYGGVNAVRSADVEVKPGKLTRVSLRHKAGKVRLKLVRDRGGDPIAGTRWTVYSTDGEPIFERVGAHADITLAEGEYNVVAHHRNTRFSRTIEVRSGDEAEVEVLANRL